MAAVAFDVDAERDRRRERLAARILRNTAWLAVIGSILAALSAWQHATLRSALPSLPITPGGDALIAGIALALLVASWRGLCRHRLEAPPAKREHGRSAAIAALPGWVCLGLVALFWIHIGWLVVYHTFFCPCR